MISELNGVGVADDHSEGGSAMVLFALAVFFAICYFLALGVRMMFLIF